MRLPYHAPHQAQQRTGQLLLHVTLTNQLRTDLQPMSGAECSACFERGARGQAGRLTPPLRCTHMHMHMPCTCTCTCTCTCSTCDASAMHVLHVHVHGHGHMDMDMDMDMRMHIHMHMYMCMCM